MAYLQTLNGGRIAATPDERGNIFTGEYTRSRFIYQSVNVYSRRKDRSAGSRGSPSEIHSEAKRCLHHKPLRVYVASPFRCYSIRSWSFSVNESYSRGKIFSLSWNFHRIILYSAVFHRRVAFNRITAQLFNRTFLSQKLRELLKIT